jgi:DNA-binding response OmpR family regulator
MRHTVLVVHDDPEVQEVLRASLPPRSFVVIAAPDPVSALTLLLWTPVALVVMGPDAGGPQHDMPSAFQLLKCIRSEASLADVPVLMFGDSTLTEWDERTFESSHAEVFRKIKGVAPLVSRIEALSHICPKTVVRSPSYTYN